MSYGFMQALELFPRLLQLIELYPNTRTAFKNHVSTQFIVFLSHITRKFQLKSLLNLLVGRIIRSDLDVSAMAASNCCNSWQRRSFECSSSNREGILWMIAYSTLHIIPILMSHVWIRLRMNIRKLSIIPWPLVANTINSRKTIKERLINWRLINSNNLLAHLFLNNSRWSCDVWRTRSIYWKIGLILLGYVFDILKALVILFRRYEVMYMRYNRVQALLTDSVDRRREIIAAWNDLSQLLLNSHNSHLGAIHILYIGIS